MQEIQSGESGQEARPEGIAQPVSEPSFAQDMTVLERNYAVLGLTLTPLGLFAALAAAGITWALPGLLVVCLVGPFAAWTGNPLPKRRRRSVRVDRGGLWVGGRRVTDRPGNLRFFPQPRRGRMSVVVRSGAAGLRRTEIEVQNEAQRRSLLTAMSADHARRTVRFGGCRQPTGAWQQIASVLLAMVLVCPAAILVARLAGLYGGGFVGLLCMAALYYGSSIWVGVDGIQLRLPWSRRFIPYEEIERAEHLGDYVTLFVRSGDPIDLVLFQPTSRLFRSGADPRDAAVYLINQAIRNHRLGDSAKHAATLLAREGLTTADWLKRLRNLSLRDASPYRKAAMDADQLWRTAEDPASPPDARVGAAVVLRDSMDARGRARLRVAAAASASPDVRAALDAAADEDEDEQHLMRTLERVGRGRE